jgi:serine/threonine protein kinase
MPLSDGTRLGSYQILFALEAGGMGEVYRARDTRLDRDVAIKILPEAFADDAERVSRFQREAKVLASLNHPHIATIYGLEDAEGVKALVMELVEGEDLAQRLARGAMPLNGGLPVAKQMHTGIGKVATIGSAIVNRASGSDGPVAVVDGNLTENLNEIEMRLWTGCCVVKLVVEESDSSWICRQITSARAGKHGQAENKRNAVAHFGFAWGGDSERPTYATRTACRPL